MGKNLPYMSLMKKSTPGLGLELKALWALREGWKMSLKGNWGLASSLPN